MKKIDFRSRLIAAGVAVVAASSMANAALTTPTVAYDDLYAVGTLALGVAVVVFLVKKAIGFFGR